MIEITQDPVGLGLSGGYDGGGPKLIIHTTEGGGADGPEQFAARNLVRILSTHDAILATWRRGNGYPSHLLVTVQLRLAVQCLPFTSPAPTLEDRAGGIRPNRAGSPLLQWEVTGHAAQLDAEWNADDWAWFGELVRQECARHGIPDAFPFPFLSSPAPAYGPTQWGGGAARLDGPTFRDASGVLGHQHVPENLHSDPGLLRLDLMMRPTLPPPLPPDPGTPVPPTTGDPDMATVYVRNAEPRVINPHLEPRTPVNPAGPTVPWPANLIVYVIEGGKIRNARQGEGKAISATQTVVPLTNAELDDAYAALRDGLV